MICRLGFGILTFEIRTFYGTVAEWSGRALQKLPQRFESARYLTLKTAGTCSRFFYWVTGEEWIIEYRNDRIIECAIGDWLIGWIFEGYPGLKWFCGRGFDLMHLQVPKHKSLLRGKRLLKIWGLKELFGNHLKFNFSNVGITEIYIGFKGA